MGRASERGGALPCRIKRGLTTAAPPAQVHPPHARRPLGQQCAGESAARDCRRGQARGRLAGGRASRRLRRGAAAWPTTRPKTRPKTRPGRPARGLRPGLRCHSPRLRCLPSPLPSPALPVNSHPSPPRLLLLFTPYPPPPPAFPLPPLHTHDLSVWRCSGRARKRGEPSRQTRE